MHIPATTDCLVSPLASYVGICQFQSPIVDLSCEQNLLPSKHIGTNLAVRIHLGNVNRPCSRSIPTVQNPSRIRDGWKYQSSVKHSIKNVMLDRQPLGLFLSHSQLYSTNHGQHYLVNRGKVNLILQCILLVMPVVK